MAFLDASAQLPIEARVAVFDNDGTLWCERPAYVQLAYLQHVLAGRAATDPSLAERPEYAAVLGQDMAAIGGLGIERVAMALVELCAGITPEQYTADVRTFMAAARHPTLAMPLGQTVYQPMLELIDELRQRDFSVFIVTGGGTEFVRAISQQLYGVPPEGVVGTLIGYELERRDGRPVLVRGTTLGSLANEGEAKITHIQSYLGRRPVLAGGNSAGDQAMLEYAIAGDGPTLALLIDHDDAEREFAYESEAVTFDGAEPISAVATRQGWTVASMRDDWATIFPPSA